MTSPKLREPVLVTGATGFIGSHLVTRLVTEGHTVRALVLPDEVVTAPWQSQVDVHRGDVSDRVAVDRAVEGAGTVFHLAAVVKDWGSESLHQRVTIGGTEHVLGAAAANGARALLASSIVVYGHRLHGEVCREDVPFGKALGPYSRSKQAQEEIARRLEKDAGLDLVIVRPANVFGPGSVPWVHEVIRELQRGSIMLIGGGELNAGLCHVDNLVEVMMRAAAQDGATSRAYNAADGSDVTWKRYFSDLARLAGTKPPRSGPRALAAAAAHLCDAVWKLGIFSRRPPISREALNLVGSDLNISTERAQSELGYRPIVDYEDAMAGLRVERNSL